MNPKTLLTAAASFLACFALTNRTEAISHTFVFDYFQLPPHTTLNPPAPGGPFGSITISDNVLHPNRVNIDLNIQNIPAPYNGVALEQFYLNFDPNLSFGGTIFYLVTQGAADPANSNDNPFPLADRLGGVQQGAGLTLGGGSLFTFDVNPDPTSGNYLFQGSLARYSTAPSPDAVIDLNADMFNFASSGGGNPAMFAAFRLSNGPNGIGEFFAFASTSTSVPDTANTFVLFGAALLGFAAFSRKKFNS